MIADLVDWPTKSAIIQVDLLTYSSNISPMKKTFLHPKETRRYKKFLVYLSSHYFVLDLYGLSILMVGLFCTQTLTIVGAVTVR